MPRYLTPIQRRMVDAGTAIRTDSATDLDFLHAALCGVFLPYRDPGEMETWERRSGAAVLRLEAGAIMDPAAMKFRKVGLPFGTKARLITIHLCSEAIRTGSSVIEVEDSLTAYVRRLGLHADGRGVRAVKEQLGRLSAATVRLGYVRDGRATQVNTQLISGLDLWAPSDPRQRILWPSTVRLSDEFFADVQRHAVPLNHHAIGALANSAAGLDTYVWLASRLCRVPEQRPQVISWASLHEQFGTGFVRLRKFRETFTDTLRKVLLVYEDARVEAGDDGLTLRRSRPPVAPKVHQLR